MLKSMTRVCVAVSAAVALGALGITEVGVSGAATAAPHLVNASALVSGAAAVPGAFAWVKRYNGPGNGFDAASSVAVSSSGGRVFVTGISTGATSGQGYATAAYSAATGKRLWISRYNGPGNGTEGATSVAVSVSGKSVFVTGYSPGATSREDYATVAYNAATGARLWVKRYNGPGNNTDIAQAVTVSPSGGTVVVTGGSTGSTSDFDYATVAYNPVTGARLWVKRYNGPGNGFDNAHSVAAWLGAIGADTVFVTGESTSATSQEDYATIAYNAVTGAQLWVKRYNGPGNDVDQARSVAVSPRGGTVLVTGTSRAASLSYDYATVAYNPATGARRWAHRYSGPTGRNYASSLAVSPTGKAVFVTGSARGARSDFDYATVAYSTATGAQLWARRYNGPGNGPDYASAVAVSPGGKTVFITGASPGATSRADYATLAYSTATGAQLWARRYNGPANGPDFGSAVAVSPSGDTVFVTGQSTGATSNRDYATIAYRG